MALGVAFVLQAVGRFGCANVSEIISAYASAELQGISFVILRGRNNNKEVMLETVRHNA